MCRVWNFQGRWVKFKCFVREYGYGGPRWPCSPQTQKYADDMHSGEEKKEDFITKTHERGTL